MDTYPLSHKNLNQNHQIVIQEERKSNCSEPQHSTQQVIEEGPEFNLAKRAQQIKINRDKLLKYVALTEKNTNISHLTSSDIPHKAQQETILMKTTQLNRTPSHPSSKQIQHKITPNKTRLKTYTGKENTCKPILPKMYLRDTESTKILNKTTSSISFKAMHDKPSILEFKQEHSTKFNSKVNHNKSNISGKSSSNNFKITSNHNKSILNKSLNKIPSLSKCRYLNPIEKSDEMSVDRSQIMSALVNINEKQGHLILSKKVLEEKIKELKDNIQKQQNCLDQMVKNRQKINSYMSKQQYSSRHSLSGAKIFKKKYQNCQLQTKNIEQKLLQISQCNLKVTQAIDEEKQLVNMYESVIQQLRGQLKSEKQAKLELQKKVSTMKKTMKTVEAKAAAQQNNTRQIFQKIFISLDKWN